MGGKFISDSQQYSEDELREVLRHFIEALLKSNPQLKMAPDKKEQLIDSLTKTFIQNGNNTRGLFYDKDFLKLLTATLKTALTIQNSNEFNSFLQKLKLVFEKNNLKLDHLAKLKPEEFKKLLENLSPDQQKQLKKDIAALVLQLRQNLAITLGLPRPTPEDKKRIEENPYENLYGLISMIPGSLAVPILEYNGNGLAIVAFNYFEGSSPINTINKTTDSAFGDALALNALTMMNFLKFDGDEFIDQFKQDIYAQGFAPGAQPNTLDRH